jgi:hypothetical protein
VTTGAIDREYDGAFEDFVSTRESAWLKVCGLSYGDEQCLIFETRLKGLSHTAWLIWTADGLGLDDFELEQTSKSATDAASNAYVEGIADKDWVHAAALAGGPRGEAGAVQLRRRSVA